MEKLIQKNLRKDVKHIISMQSLLQEYDRENKYLNKQVLDLLNENTKLRMDKVKVNIINDMFKTDKKLKTPTKQNTFIDKSEFNTTNSKKEERIESTNKLTRNSSKKIIQKFKIQRDQEVIQAQIIKKDEGVQTYQPESLSNIPQQQTQKGKQQTAFSFRKIEGLFETPSISSKQIISQMDVKFDGSLKQIERQKNVQTENVVISHQNEMIPSQTQNISFTSIAVTDHQTIKRENSIVQHLKRSHAIKPSPQIVTSSSKNKVMMTPSASEHKLEFRSQSKPKIRPFESVQKKKKFLEVVTNALTPTRIIISREKEDCC